MNRLLTFEAFHLSKFQDTTGKTAKINDIIKLEDDTIGKVIRFENDKMVVDLNSHFLNLNTSSVFTILNEVDDNIKKVFLKESKDEVLKVDTEVIFNETEGEVFFSQDHLKDTDIEDFYGQKAIVIDVMKVSGKHYYDIEFGNGVIFYSVPAEYLDTKITESKEEEKINGEDIFKIISKDYTYRKLAKMSLKAKDELMDVYIEDYCKECTSKEKADVKDYLIDYLNQEEPSTEKHTEYEDYFRSFIISNVFYYENGDDELTADKAEKSADKFKEKMTKFLTSKNMSFEVDKDNDFKGYGYIFKVKTTLTNLEDIIKIFPKGKFTDAIIYYKDDDINLD